MGTQIKRVGHGQVEPNHLSGIATGQIHAQLPANSDLKILEQGMFVKYDEANGEVNLTGAGEWMLVYNEEHFYDPRYESHKDYAMRPEEFVDKIMVPRLIKTNVEDIYTTNTFGQNLSNLAEVEGLELDVNDFLMVDSNTGYLKKGDGRTEAVPTMTWQITKVYTMPDGQPGVKLRRVY